MRLNDLDKGREYIFVVRTCLSRRRRDQVRFVVKNSPPPLAGFSTCPSLKKRGKLTSLRLWRDVFFRRVRGPDGHNKLTKFTLYSLELFFN